MAQTYTINGVAYTFPDVDDSDWGQNVTDWAGAVSSFLLQRSGGTFTLSAEVDFGSSYGLLVKDLGSKTANPASAGFLQLAKTDVIAWRNNANSGDINLEKGTDDLLQFNSIDLVDLSTAQTLTNKTMTSPVINTGISGTAIDDNTSLGSSATKVPTQNAVKSYVDAQLTASDLDFSGDSGGAQSVDLDSQSLTVEGGTGVDTTGSAQKISIAIDSSVTTNSGSQTLTNKTLTTPIIGSISNTGTLTLPTSTDTLVGRATTDTLTNKTLTSPKINEDVVMTTTSTYLNRMDATSNVQAQIDSKQATITGAATTIASSDLTASKVLQSNGSGKVEASTVTTTTLGYLDATSSVQTQLDAKAPLASPYFTTYADFDSQGSAPAAPSNTGDVRLYAKDSKFYFHPQGGSATEVGSGGGAGDADTIQLKAANDFDAVNTAPWYTGNNPVPGGGGSIGGTWELSTSNPLINTNDATKVFHYSNGTSDRKGDYFEIELDVPNYAKGHNLVVQLFYRTVGAEDTDFLFFARDRTGDYSTTTTSTGAQTTITLASATGFAVGDRICLQDSSEDRHFRYVTAVSGSDITFSGSAITFASGDAVVSKFFTDELDFITAENNTTNYEGKIRKWAFKINDTTTKIRVGFLYDNSATSTNELFFDQILLSSNQFLQTSSRGQTESYIFTQGSTAFWQSSSGDEDEWHWESLVAQVGTPTITNSKLIDIQDVSNQTRIYALENVEISCSFQASMTNESWAAIQNSSGAAIAMTHESASYTFSPRPRSTSATFLLAKGDYVSFRCNGLSTSDGGAAITVVPQVNDVVLLNSQDEIFTDWVDYTPSFPTANWADGGANIVNHCRWRRVGSNMEVDVSFTMNSGSPSSAQPLFPLPSGYSIRPDVIVQHTFCEGFLSRITSTNSLISDGRANLMAYVAGNSTQLSMIFRAANGTTLTYDPINNLFAAGDTIAGTFSVPIAGWTSTFNPVLSMPLVNFDRVWNTYQARIGGDGSLTSQSDNFISSVSGGSGAVTVNYVSGLFTETPSVTISARGISANRGLYISASSATSFTVQTWQVSSGATTSEQIDFDCSVTTQGADWKEPPQPTAAVIKPAVCIIRDIQNDAVDGGEVTDAMDDSVQKRTLNTMYGETWFCTLSASVFTLEPGMYKLHGKAPFYQTSYTTLGLYDVSNSAWVSGARDAGWLGSSSGQTISLAFSAVVTITSSTQFQLGYTVKSGHGHSTWNLGAGQSYTAAEAIAVHSEVVIEKLK